METTHYKNWWFLALNGCLFTIFGLLILFFTKEFIESILVYVGIVMLAGGAILMFAGINNLRRDKSGAMVLAESIIAIAIGLALLFFPMASVKLFLILMGIWAIVVGIIQLVIIVNVKGEFSGKNLFMLNGLLTIGLGILLLFNPFPSAFLLDKIIGGAAALFGILLIVFAFVLRSVKNPGNEPTVGS